MKEMAIRPFAILTGICGLASASVYAGGWAAIAFDKATGVYGRYQGADTQADAEASSLDRCATVTTNCHIIVDAYAFN